MAESMQFQTTHQAMGTVMAHKAFGRDAEECLRSVCMEIDNLESLLSRFIPESEVSRINDSSGLLIESLSQSTMEILIKAVEFSDLCQGVFDITVGPLVDLWGQSKLTGVPPNSESIERVLPLINYQELILDPYQQTGGLNLPGQAIDLGGIGKGFAGDKVAALYRAFGITSAYSNIGGNVVAIGAKPDGSGWRVGVQHPRQPKQVIGVIAVSDAAVVTSGDYQRAYLASPDWKYHHILDLRIGYPAESELISVTIVSPQAVVADVLSTAVFIAGMERGLEILNYFCGSEAVLINRDLEVFVTAGLKSCFQPQENITISVINSNKENKNETEKEK
jgi:thiamine biosynthesis lipoprotein